MPSVAYVLVPGVRYFTFAGAPFLIMGPDRRPMARTGATLATCASTCSLVVIPVECQAFQLLLDDIGPEDGDQVGTCYFYSKDPVAYSAVFPDPRTLLGAKRTGQ